MAKYCWVIFHSWHEIWGKFEGWNVLGVYETKESCERDIKMLAAGETVTIPGAEEDKVLHRNICDRLPDKLGGFYCGENDMGYPSYSYGHDYHCQGCLWAEKTLLMS